MTGDRFVEVGGARVRYWLDGRGPVVLLVHGLGASVESWAWTIPALREAFTAVALDLPGFGRSDPLPGLEGPESAARFVLAFMDTLGLREAALVGSSLGAAVATLAAGRAPDRCTALVLASPPAFTRDLSILMRAATLPALGELFAGVVARWPRVGARSAFADRRSLPPALVETTRANFREGAAGATALRVLRRAVGLGGVRPDVVAELHRAARRITAPVLVVWGDRDRVVRRRQVEAAVRALPGARLCVLEGVGHAPFIEAPEAFNAVVLDFLAPLTRGAPARAAP